MDIIKENIIKNRLKGINQKINKKLTKYGTIYFLLKFFIIINLLKISTTGVKINKILKNSYSFITLKIMKKGYQKIFYKNSCTNRFPFPDEVHINDVNSSNINRPYLDTENNTIKLIWYNNIKTSVCMFSGCSNVTEIDLSNFNTSEILDMHVMFRYCSSLTSINFNNIIVSQVLNMSYLFHGCTSLISLDLSNFYTYNITDISNMFCNCSSLISLDLTSFQTPYLTTINQLFIDCKELKAVNLSSFNTSKVTQMNGVFYRCYALTSLDVNHFNTSAVTNMGRMFSECKSLTSLNLSNFDLSQCNDLGAVFMDSINLEYLNLENSNSGTYGGNILTNTKKNIVVCTQDRKIINSIRLCGIADCSENWREKRKKINLENDTCVDNCSLINYKFEYDSNCYKQCPNGTYNNNYLCEKCHPDCKTCDEKYEQENTKCKSCSSPDKFLYLGNCVTNCSNGFYYDEKDPSIKKCKCELNKCFICSKESLSDKTCITCNEGFYQKYDEYLYNMNNDNLFIDCYQSPIGYFLDNDAFYKKCYFTCEICNISGNETYHNCLECKSDYNLEILFGEYKNCYNNCSNYYYFDKNQNKTFCTKIKKCPEKYNKLIEDKRECVSECFSNNLYKYEFRNNCYINCPPESISPENISYYFPEDIIQNINKDKKFYCEANCTEKYPLEKVYTQECVNKCSTNEIKLKLCIKKLTNYNTEKESKEEHTKVEDLIMENIEVDFTSEEYNTSDIEKGQDISIVESKFTITLTTTENQKNNNDSNIITIDLEECEILLRNHYKLRDDQKIFIKRIDVIQDGMKIPKIEYDVYCKLTDTNLIKLNLSICQKVKTNLFIPVIIDENIDILNSSSGYYNDICYTYTTDKGTDIILDDRKNEFIINNKTVCQDDCDFSEYDYQTKKAKCSC